MNKHAAIARHDKALVVTPPMTPQFFARQCRAFAQRFQLRPGNLGMDAHPHPAVGTCYDVLAADETRIEKDPIGHELRMLDDVAGVTDDARNQDLARRQPGFFPDLPFVFVSRIRGLDRIRAGFHPEHQIDHVFQRQVMRVRSVPASPTDVITNAVFGDALQRVIHRLDSHRCELSVLLDARRGHDHVVGIRQCRVVDLKNKTSINDGFVFVLDRVGQSEQVVFIGRSVRCRRSAPASREPGRT